MSPSSGGGKIILPAIQREFIWKPKDIAKLFDSLMREYPINTMLFWEISNLANIPIQFYKFLDPAYTKGDINTVIGINNTVQDYLVVIDGQQRLTSLYIALKGSYKSDTPNALPQELYLRLDKKDTSSDSDMQYDFCFLTQAQYNRNSKKGEIWFKVKEAISPSFNPMSWLMGNNLAGNSFAVDSMNKLCKCLTDNNIINYYEVKAPKIDDVLDIFIRTNSGGYVLTKGALLLSTLASQWAVNHQDNARTYVEDMIDDVKTKGYKIDKDWVLKCCGMLVGTRASVTVSTFSAGNVCDDIYKNRDKIRQSISKTFELVQSFGLIDKGLSTKLAIIPLVYFVYKNNLGKTTINSTNRQKQNWYDMRKFLFRAILKNLFEASTDTVLDKIKSTIDSTGGSFFPYSDIEKTCTELAIAAADIIDIVHTRKKEAFPALNIIYALKAITLNPILNYDVDHIHPKKNFDSNALSSITFNTPNDELRAKDRITFDTLVNLQLLESSHNRSKNAKDLQDWYSSMRPSDRINWRSNNIINGTVSLALEDFGTFIDERERDFGGILNSDL